MGTRFLAVLLAAGLGWSAMADDAVGPRTFVAQLYLKALNNRHFSYVSPRLLAPDLYDLAQRGGSAPNGALEYDPICQCRDNDGVSARISSLAVTGDRAVATILLQFDGTHPPPPQRVTLVLTHAPLAGWKIADIQSARVPSLKALLARRGGRARG
jgi:hypothetical protein